MGRVGERWRPRRCWWSMTVAMAPRRLACGFGVRGGCCCANPCRARLDGSELVVAQTAEQPCDPGQVLSIAAGATVRFDGVWER